MSSKPIHIVHAVWHFSTGGLENGVVNLINHLPADKFVHSIVTLTGFDPQFAQRITSGNVQFYQLDKKEGQDWSVFAKFKRLLATLKPDILHTRNLATLELQVIAWWQRIPLRLHGEHGWDSYDVGGSNRKYRLLRRLIKPFVHQFVCLSTESEHYLRTHIRLPESKITRICNGVDTAKYSNALPAALKMPEAITTSEPVLFGTVGRLAQIKNQAFLLRSFALMLQQHPEFAASTGLVLVGDGPCRAELETLCNELKLDKQVTFCGNRSDIPQVMQCLTVFVLPSLAEGISNTILEAMASGTPVIATNVGGNPDLLPDTLQDTNLVPVDDIQRLSDAMLRYLQTPATVEQDANIVKNHCHQNFSIDTMVARYQELYTKTRTQN